MNSSCWFDTTIFLASPSALAKGASSPPAASRPGQASQVEGGAAAERHRGHRVERLTDVAERRLEAEGEEDDAGNHRQVEVAVGVQREPVQLQALRLHQPPPCEDRGHVEVEPPERRDHNDSERRRHDHSRIQLEAGAEADGDYRLAERDQNDQRVPFGEVLGRDPPAAPHADHDWAEVVDRKRDEPDRDALAPLEEAGQHEQGGAEDRRRREPEKRAAAVGIVANDDGGEDEMKQADEEVGDTEQHGVVSKGARHRQGDAEHHAHRGEHHQPDATLVDIHRARQPRIYAPRPPERGEDEHPAEDATPRRVVREQDRDVGDREHEGEVEEELERSDLVFVAALLLALGHAPTPARIRLRRSRLPPPPGRASLSSSRGGSAPPRTSSRAQRCTSGW